MSGTRISTGPAPDPAHRGSPIVHSLIVNAGRLYCDSLPDSTNHGDHDGNDMVVVAMVIVVTDDDRNHCGC